MQQKKICKALESEEVSIESKELAKNQPRRLRNFGKRSFLIRFAGGTSVKLIADYYAKKKKCKKREEGFYPALYLLGIHDKCTPALASEVSMLSAALCSLEETTQMLHNRGCNLNIKTIRNIIKRYAVRARLSQEDNQTELFLEAKTITGRKIVVSTDGGRMRIRKKKAEKTKKVRNRYHTDWREPKLLIIYVVNEQGRLDKKFSPFIDGTLNGPDEIFGLIKYYLKKLNIILADKILFVADGAHWIWDRVEKLIKSLGLKTQQVLQLLDFYHAIEHLHNLANLVKGWREKERKRWVKIQRHNLRIGKLDIVFAAIRMLCRGRKNKALRRERDYFVVRNKKRLDYVGTADLNFPIGSGAIESSIRRVVNLRLKGPCIFWKEDTANEMLMLRCYYKAKRWGMLHSMACQGGVTL